MFTSERSIRYREASVVLRMPVLATALCSLFLLAQSPGALAAPQTNPADTVVVLVDHAKVVRLPEKAQTVIVGNPGIADVSVQKNGVMIVTGKSFGVTNLIALDAAGTLLAESLVRVGAASDSVLTVQRGLDRESYSCTPMCQPSLQLGDATRFFSDTNSQTNTRNEMAAGTGRR
jgi:hypothetical protein